MIEDFDKNLFIKCAVYFKWPATVFDIGAHKGDFTKFVFSMLPNADCYMFEPNRELLNDFKHLQRYGYAVSDTNGQKVFYMPPVQNDELSSLYKRDVFNQTGYTEKTVRCITIDYFSKIMSIDEIDYIKVDVEGAELDVVKGCAGMMTQKKIKFIQLEYGGTYPDAGITFVDIISAANELGYKVYELVKNKFVEATKDNFIEDYRYQVFLLTYLPC